MPFCVAWLVTVVQGSSLPESDDVVMVQGNSPSEGGEVMLVQGKQSSWEWWRRCLPSGELGENYVILEEIITTKGNWGIVHLNDRGVLWHLQGNRPPECEISNLLKVEWAVLQMTELCVSCFSPGAPLYPLASLYPLRRGWQDSFIMGCNGGFPVGLAGFLHLSHTLKVLGVAWVAVGCSIAPGMPLDEPAQGGLSFCWHEV